MSKMSENGEIYTASKKFTLPPVTSGTNLTPVQDPCVPLAWLQHMAFFALAMDPKNPVPIPLISSMGESRHHLYFHYY